MPDLHKMETIVLLPMHKITLYLLVVLLNWGNLSWAGETNTCPAIPDHTSTTVVKAYLRQGHTRVTRACVSQAFALLGRTVDEEALPLMLEYLDFEVPTEPGVPRAMVRVTPTGGDYPAADAIAEFGVGAIPTLETFLAHSSNRVAARKVINAARALIAVQADRSRLFSLLRATAKRADQDAFVTRELLRMTSGWPEQA